MLETVICIFAIFSFAFMVKETDGPFGIIDKIRLTIYRLKYIGPMVYKLLQCYFCTGFYAGIFVYLLHNHFQDISGYDMVLWALAGACVSMCMSLIMNRVAISEK